MDVVTEREYIPDTKEKRLKKFNLKIFINQLNCGWEIIDLHHLEKEFSFNDFQDALEFTKKIVKVSGRENHHPVIQLNYDKVKIFIWTKSINGLSKNDFILASKIEKLK